MSLSSMYAKYLESQKVHKDRDPMRLFVSDVGKCPRMLAYRLTGMEKDPVSVQAMYNKTIMFDIAFHMENMLEFALGDCLIAREYDIHMPERTNWGGRCDFIADYDGVRVIELKTVIPNAFKFDLDYPEHHAQAAVYDIYLRDEFNFTAPPLLVYFDRGGQNTPREKEVTYSKDAVLGWMDQLERVRDTVPDMPEKLPKVLKERTYKKEIKLEPDYRCGRCDYALTCQPDTSTQLWAKRETASVPYVACRKAQPEQLAAFATKMAMEVLF